MDSFKTTVFYSLLEIATNPFANHSKIVANLMFLCAQNSKEWADVYHVSPSTSPRKKTAYDNMWLLAKTWHDYLTIYKNLPTNHKKKFEAIKLAIEKANSFNACDKIYIAIIKKAQKNPYDFKEILESLRKKRVQLASSPVQCMRILFESKDDSERKDASEKIYSLNFSFYHWKNILSKYFFKNRKIFRDIIIQKIPSEAAHEQWSKIYNKLSSKKHLPDVTLLLNMISQRLETSSSNNQNFLAKKFFEKVLQI